MKAAREGALFRQAGVAPGQNVLDIGFRDLEELQTITSLVGPTGHVLGIDINPRHVQIAAEKLVDLPSPNISVKEGSISAIPAEDGAFDLVLCKGILHEVPQLDQAVAEMARVCRPGGLIAVMDFQRISRLKFELYRALVYLRSRRCDDRYPGFTREQLRRLLARHHLEEFDYRQLPDKGRLGFIKADRFLLKAKRES
jgi:ubiquinone/menaquinone biosynthesis C-methylase UbiE